MPLKSMELTEDEYRGLIGFLERMLRGFESSRGLDAEADETADLLRALLVKFHRAEGTK